jgi:uncharacterized coiled-coil protein SlyX
MIRIEIDGKSIRTILDEKEAKITDLNSQIAKLDKSVTRINKNLDKQGDELKELQRQIIESRTEDVKERKSLWAFLTTKNKPTREEEPRKDRKTSRLTESIVTLYK